MLADVAAEDLLSDRAKQLLKALIETHIAEGEPVGSRTLARVSGLDVSPATIRNIMSDLEEAGLIASPHTSAGRIPTAAGYRLFIDSLIQVKSPRPGLVEDFDAQVRSASNIQGMTQSASMLLSNLTRMASVVTLPKAGLVTLRQIEFVRLGDKRVLAVLVLDHGEVQNRVVTLDRDYSRAELERAGNYLTEHCLGLDIRNARRKIFSELKKLREDLDSLMASTIALAEQALAGADDETEDCIVAGQTRLMDYTELSDIERLRQLFDTFNQKRDILHILDRCVRAKGVQIYIGQESGSKVLDVCSVVTAPYSVDGRIVGVLGVIGPTRMAYDRVIPIVDISARLFGAALNSR
ncbi:MAG: heat-inducible transcriptional repressor HrcA [Thiotrichales bacterium]